MSRFEIFYLKANDPVTKRALWVRELHMGGRVWRWAVLTDPARERPCVFVSPALPDDAVRRDPSGLLHYTRNDMPIAWDLHWDDPGNSQRILPHWIYCLPLPTKYESPHWNGRISGMLKFPFPQVWLSASGGGGGQEVGAVQEWTLTRWPAQMGHIWGYGMAASWGWAHGNVFEEDDTACFEMLVSPLPSGKTVLRLKSRDIDLCWNQPWQWWRARHWWDAHRWQWDLHVGDTKVTGDFQSTQMTHLHYEIPGLPTRDCYNTKIGDGRITVQIAGHSPLVLTASKALAWEYVR